jgi:mono/diheme cytochrome c family protein
MADKERSIRYVLHGASGEIEVSGKKYNGIMAPMNYLSDEDVANVLTFVRNGMGNSGDAVSISEVQRIRGEAPAAPTATFE